MAGQVFFALVGGFQKLAGCIPDFIAIVAFPAVVFRIQLPVSVVGILEEIAGQFFLRDAGGLLGLGPGYIVGDVAAPLLESLFQEIIPA